MAGGEDVGVSTVTAAQRVIAGAAGEAVEAFAPSQGVVACAAAEGIVAVAAGKAVVAGRALHDVLTIPAGLNIIVFGTDKGHGQGGDIGLVEGGIIKGKTDETVPCVVEEATQGDAVVAAVGADDKVVADGEELNVGGACAGKAQGGDIAVEVDYIRQRVLPVAGGEDVGVSTVTAAQRVVAAAAVEQVIAAGTDKPVITFPPSQMVIVVIPI